MGTGWEMLPETAKAISAPLTKLIEVVSDGCGRLYEPRHIRKKAAAEGEALVLMEIAKAHASEVAIRAAHRALDLEVRRQHNIESIVAKTEAQLPNEVSTEPVDADWATRVIQTCQDISDDEMQALWAKLLAGEVAHPGAFSLRTVQVLSQLSKEEALAFESMCTQAPTINGQHVVLIFTVDQDAAWSAGLNGIGVLNALVEAGLLDRADMGKTWARPPGTSVDLEFAGRERLRVTNEKAEEKFTLVVPGHVPAGIYSLTGAGRELARLVESNPAPERIEYLMQAFIAEKMTVLRERLSET